MVKQTPQYKNILNEKIKIICATINSDQVMCWDGKACLSSRVVDRK